MIGPLRLYPLGLRLGCSLSRFRSRARRGMLRLPRCACNSARVGAARHRQGAGSSAARIVSGRPWIRSRSECSAPSHTQEPSPIDAAEAAQSRPEPDARKHRSLPAILSRLWFECSTLFFVVRMASLFSMLCAPAGGTVKTEILSLVLAALETLQLIPLANCGAAAAARARRRLLERPLPS